jgi:hypothetical protein
MDGMALLLGPLLGLLPALLGQPPLRKAPPLPEPTGPVVHVSNTEELQRAARELADGSTILVADGTYHLDRFLHLDQKRNVGLRGAAGDPAKVVLEGRGWDADDQDDILRVSRCEGVTVAHLTFQNCHSYGIKVEGEHSPREVRIYDCRFRDIGMRAIKGSASETCRVVGGSVRYCDFENTKVPPADWLYDGDYITAIDMMALESWTFSDNTFRNIRGRNGAARGAIFVWVRSRDVTVERNVILNCDRGIALGNPSMSTASRHHETHVADSICRNNVIVCGPDAGIELAWARDVKVLSNTIWRVEGSGRGIRCIQNLVGVSLANNLVRGEIMLTEGVTAEHNVAGALDGYFVDPANGDLRLTAQATAALGRALPLPDVTDDVSGRLRGPKPDLGAVQCSG